MSDFELLPIEDGLPTTPAGEWSVEKFRLLEYYASIFSTGMKGRWDRVYIDLFAGSGYAQVGGTGQLQFGSPLIALRVRDKFSRYVFCDADERALEALRARVERHSRGADVRFICGDCNAVTTRIISEVLSPPLKSPLSLCFVDPFNVALKRRTFEALSTGLNKVDFLILLALWMDARRNEFYYTKPENPRINALLDDPDWRADWEAARESGMRFGQYLATRFTTSMMNLGYIESSSSNWHEVRMHAEGAPLYHLMFFSKHAKGYDFWKKAQKYGSTQKKLDL